MSRSLAALVLCVASAAAAQEAAPTATLSVQAKLVAFDAVVRDKRGEPVHGLTREDVSLLVDGKPQAIRYFSEDTDLPLTIALMVDTSGSQQRFFVSHQAASNSFLTHMLTGANDQAAILRFDTSVRPLQGLTHSLPLLSEALGKLAITYPPDPNAKGGTVLFDALCTVQRQRGSETRRAAVLLTDGEDSGSRATRDQAIACAQRDGVAVYAVVYSTREEIQDERFDPKVMVYPHEHLPGRTNLERLARSTGGRVFLVSHQPIEAIYAAMEAELRSQYRLGFTPPAAASGSYHTLELRAKDKRLKVQARLGYYAR